MTEAEDKIRELEKKVVDLQLGALRKEVDDHERRIRAVEEISTRFNFLLSLTVGGGLLSLINLINTFFTLHK